MEKLEQQVNAKLAAMADLESAQDLIDENLDLVSGGVAGFFQHISEFVCPDCW